MDGFGQDEPESKRDERAVIPRRLLATQRDALESFELSDCSIDVGATFVKSFRKEGGNVFSVDRSPGRFRAGVRPSRSDLESLPVKFIGRSQMAVVRSRRGDAGGRLSLRWRREGVARGHSMAAIIVDAVH